MHVYLNGALIETQTTTVNLPTGGSVDIAVSIQPFMNIPANTSATISFATSTSGSVSALGPEYNDTDRAVWLMALS
ncbi:hypothetical protein D3C84_494960 [compost metagenome]